MGEKKEFPVGVFQRFEDLGIVMTLDCKLAEECEAADGKASDIL